MVLGLNWGQSQIEIKWSFYQFPGPTKGRFNFDPKLLSVPPLLWLSIVVWPIHFFFNSFSKTTFENRFIFLSIKLKKNTKRTPRWAAIIDWQTENHSSNSMSYPLSLSCFSHSFRPFLTESSFGDESLISIWINGWLRGQMLEFLFSRQGYYFPEVYVMSSY